MVDNPVTYFSRKFNGMECYDQLDQTGKYDDIDSEKIGDILGLDLKDAAFYDTTCYIPPKDPPMGVKITMKEVAIDNGIVFGKKLDGPYPSHVNEELEKAICGMDCHWTCFVAYALEKDGTAQSWFQCTSEVVKGFNTSFSNPDYAGGKKLVSEEVAEELLSALGKNVPADFVEKHKQEIEAVKIQITKKPAEEK